MRSLVGLLWGGSFAFFFSFYLLLGAVPIYGRQIGVSDQALGIVLGAFSFTSMLAKPWAGWACDRYGRKSLLLAGAALFLFSSLAYVVSVTAMALLLVRLVHGAGMGLYPTAASAIVADVAPPERRGEVIGFFGAAANIAMAFGPLVGMAVVDLAGFPLLFAISALSALAALATSTVVPETLQERQRLPLRVEATLSRAALFPSAIVLCLMVTYGVQVSFLPLYAYEHGLNPGLFFLVFALVVAAVRGRAGRLSDRWGRAPVAAVGLLLTAGALGALALTDTMIGLTVVGGLYGLGFGAAQPALMAWSVDRVGPGDRGRAMGTYYTALELGITGGAIGSGLAVGALGFAPAFLGAAVVALAGAGLAAQRHRVRGVPA